MSLSALHAENTVRDAEVFDDAGASVTARAALEFTRRGLPVLPCAAHAKQPITRHGLKDATANERRVRDWFHKWHTANVAIRTGDVFDVLDVDGDEGLDTLSALAGGDDAVIPSGPCARTPSGGAHLYFAPTGLGNRTRFAPGLDWRGMGGYVVVPPSLGPNGTAYEWHVEHGETFDFDRPLVPAPGWLRALVEAPNIANADAQNRRVVGAGDRTGTRVPNFWDEFKKAPSPKYAQAALADELRTVAAAPVGARNHSLNSAALKLGTLVGADMLDRDDVADGLLAAALTAGLPEREGRATIRSGLDAGVAQPRETA